MGFVDMADVDMNGGDKKQVNESEPELGFVVVDGTLFYYTIRVVLLLLLSPGLVQ